MVVGCGRNHPVARPRQTKMIVVARLAVNRDEKAVAFFDPLRNFMRQACSRRHLHLCAVHIMETASVRKVLLKCKVPPGVYCMAWSLRPLAAAARLGQARPINSALRADVEGRAACGRAR